MSQNNSTKENTFVISMLICRIVALIWGNFISAFESFMISVDF